MAVYLLVYPAGIGFMLRVTRQYRKEKYHECAASDLVGVWTVILMAHRG